MAAFLLLVLSLATLCSANVVHLTEDDWDRVLSHEWIIEFYAPWCPACRALEPTWRAFASALASDADNDVRVAQVDVTLNPGLSGRFMVTALPTIYHSVDGEFRVYRGARDEKSLLKFVEDKEWKNVEALPTWKSPAAPHMSLVSAFFKMSMVLRNVHQTITEQYGYPAWASYLGFALATILVGAVLGLVLVCCIDCVFPPARSNSRLQQPVAADVDRGAAKEDEELDEDDDEAEEEEEAEEQEEVQDADEVLAPSDPVVRKRRAKKAD